MLVQRDLKVRYKNSVLGFGWSLINPLVQVVIITLVMQHVMHVSIPNFHAYVFCATLPWLFFNTAIMDTSMSLVTFYHLMRRTYFARELLPLAAVIANLIHFFLATGVFIAYMLLNTLFHGVQYGHFEMPLQWSAPLVVIPMLGLTLLVVGISLFLSVWTLYFEDIRFLADSALRILYWALPVLWFPEMVASRTDPDWRKRLFYYFCLLNPLSIFITAFKKLMMVPTKLPGPPGPNGLPTLVITQALSAQEWGFLLLALATSAGIAVLGHRFFSVWKWKLAER